MRLKSGVLREVKLEIEAFLRQNRRMRENPENIKSLFLQNAKQLTAALAFSPLCDIRLE